MIYYIAAFLAGGIVTVLMKKSITKPVADRSLASIPPDGFSNLVRNVRTDTHLGHFLILPALSKELETRIAGEISSEKINVYRTALLPRFKHLTLWSFDKEIPPEAIADLFEIIIKRIQDWESQQ